MLYLLKKLSAKTIIGSVADIKAKLPAGAVAGQKIHLYRIGGVVEETKAGESTNGPFTALLGEFKAIDAAGNEFVGSKAFIPEPMSSMIANAVRPDSETGEVKPVQFVVDVGLNCAPESSTGYTYTVSSVLPVKNTNRIDMLFSSTEVKALPAPINPPVAAAPAAPATPATPATAPATPAKSAAPASAPATPAKSGKKR